LQIFSKRIPAQRRLAFCPQKTPCRISSLRSLRFQEGFASTPSEKRFKKSRAGTMRKQSFHVVRWSGLQLPFCFWPRFRLETNKQRLRCRFKKLQEENRK